MFYASFEYSSAGSELGINWDHVTYFCFKKKHLNIFSCFTNVCLTVLDCMYIRTCTFIPLFCTETGSYICSVCVYIRILIYIYGQYSECKVNIVDLAFLQCKYFRNIYWKELWNSCSTSIQLYLDFNYLNKNGLEEACVTNF